MPAIYGPKRAFSAKQPAEAFARHLTRELTAGGIPHWVELQEERAGRWVPFVHRASCSGRAACTCAREDD